MGAAARVLCVGNVSCSGLTRFLVCNDSGLLLVCG